MRVTLFVSGSCSLCDQVRAWLAELAGEFPHDLYVIDIDSDPVLAQKHAGVAPAVEVGPYRLETPFSETELRVTLAAAQQGDHEPAVLTEQQHNHAVIANKVLLYFSRHWLAVFNFFVFLFVGLPFLAPVLMNNGREIPARVIYKVYSPLCHQLAFRSWFLFGEQSAYPLERANTDLGTYEDFVGGTAADLRSASQFLGNADVGFKVALCERDIAIYIGILIAGLLFGLVRNWLKPLPLLLWALLGVAPMGLDGGSQLLAYMPFLDFPVRESTPFLRTLTGLLFGVMNVWMAYPYVEEAMNESRAVILTKLARVRNGPETSLPSPINQTRS